MSFTALAPVTVETVADLLESVGDVPPERIRLPPIWPSRSSASRTQPRKRSSRGVDRGAIPGKSDFVRAFWKIVASSLLSRDISVVSYEQERSRQDRLVRGGTAHGQWGRDHWSAD